jgi:hypothetical protein
MDPGFIVFGVVMLVSFALVIVRHVREGRDLASGKARWLRRWNGWPPGGGDYSSTPYDGHHSGTHHGTHHGGTGHHGGGSGGHGGGFGGGHGGGFGGHGGGFGGGHGGGHGG